ncbi:hypothetical protein CP97_10900 [Aurantiacibacter atlanticus]|uniref:Uncharacterized protein n=1 Tax=Aurantiacibacter atlanticus TaxID=1648404 RepID=A0A0H4VHR2_9SPHN|nr:lysylphosphatidylglycerol synthase domain-containing protein [Aurantiacibacter atlanticus]AKQ42426.1 hypothetical protein CP97_10900 [Aurantiacibacter atlanticus]MDF1835339.1 lysylphosphatidylglycerol synthase domain-containing protein [Alteraurantiacibacter sp. bin_em_oilr2.035]
MVVETRAQRPRWAFFLKAGFVAAALIGAAYLLHSRWNEVTEALRLFGYGDIALSAIAACAHIGFSLLAWMVLAKKGDVALRTLPALRIFFFSQIGKYIPGSVWQFLAAAQLGHDEGMSRRGVLASFAFALLAAIVAGGVLVLAVLPFSFAGTQPGGWGWAASALLPLVVFFPAVLLRIASLAKLNTVPSTLRLAASTAISAGTWLAGGAMLLLLARGLTVPVAPEDILVYSAIYAAAWITGFLVFFAPAGLGARETAMIALLSVLMPLPHATIVALLSRVLVTCADFLAAGLTLTFTRAPDV